MLSLADAGTEPLCQYSVVTVKPLIVIPLFLHHPISLHIQVLKKNKLASHIKPHYQNYRH